ncbi:glycosyltransferase family 2 protein [Candidatus Poribacteria bacterium]|nr:glycosyltransferase family 2 protein [Candidatus Poribacteria bacterium]
MSQPLVSIGMPVFNGQTYLGQTLDSLLAQDYENIELVILDNISTDATPEICRSYAKRDSRVRYLLDNSRVNVMEGHKRVAHYAKGEFFLIACDDDVYAPTYISQLMDIMRSNPAVGLVYSGLGYIYPDGTQRPVSIRERYFLRSHHSKFYNFAFYLLHRCPIPLSFGLMRTEIHREALQYYYRVDHRGWDHDNLYMLRLLSLAKVDSTRDILFYYRQRDRSNQRPADVPDAPFKRYLYQTQHQVLVTQAIFRIIDAAPFSDAEKHFLRGYNSLVLLFNCTLKHLIATAAYRRLRKSSWE